MSDPDLPNAVVAERTQETVESLESFFGTVAQQATRFARSIAPQWWDAEEMVQEACFRMMRAEQANSGVVPSHSRKAYLFRTIRNLAIDRQRKASRRPVENRPLDALPAENDQCPGQQQRRLRRMEQAIESSCATMPSGWADALKMKVNGKLSYADIAEALGATPDQVRGWIYRARKQLARDLQQQGLMETER